jgi:hypothetical protein
MPWFKRKKEETYNEQLLREAGLEAEQPPPPADPPAGPPADPLAGTYPAQNAPFAWLRGMARPAEWDVYTTAEAPEIGGDSVSFAALPTGDLIVDDEQGDADLSPLAEAVEKQLQPPYRAIGRKEEGSLWSVAARRIDVRRLAVPEGDEVELVVRDGERTVSIDGAPSDVALAGLAESGDYVAHGTRLDGDLWEIQVNRL